MNKEKLYEQVMEQMQKVHNNTELDALEISEVLVDSALNILKQVLKQSVQEAVDEQEIDKDSLKRMAETIKEEQSQLIDFMNDHMSKNKYSNKLTMTLSCLLVLSKTIPQLSDEIEVTECECGNCNTKQEADLSEVPQELKDLIERLRGDNQ